MHQFWVKLSTKQTVKLKNDYSQTHKIDQYELKDLTKTKQINPQ